MKNPENNNTYIQAYIHNVNNSYAQSYYYTRLMALFRDYPGAPVPER